MILLLSLLLTKHFIVDFLLQPPWMYKNKGQFGHPGGILHAAFHGIVTAIILESMGYGYEWLGTVEAIAHYLIDYEKVNINRYFNWTATNSEAFWRMLGLDQWLHNACYIGIVWWVT